MATDEFTKKLRTAIKVKLQELGVEAEDELPDYVMIMIANKKDKNRMKSDLSLFLNDNTDNFVNWLFDFFEKLGKKDVDETKNIDAEKPSSSLKKPPKEDSSSERVTKVSPVHHSRSRSPRSRSTRSKREPVRAPSPRREREDRERERERRSRHDDRKKKDRSRSRSPVEVDPRRHSPVEAETRRRPKTERKKITFSDSDDDLPRRTVKSQIVTSRPLDYDQPRVNSVVVKPQRKAESTVNARGASSLFKRAVEDSLRDDEPQRPRASRGILQVSSNRTSRRKVLLDEEYSEESEGEQPKPETQFVVKLGKRSATRKPITMVDDSSASDENFINRKVVAGAKRRRRPDDPVRTIMALSGGRTKKAAAPSESDESPQKRIHLIGGEAKIGRSWDGRIHIDEEEDEDSDVNEDEIDAVLAAAHRRHLPPTEALSRPIYPVVKPKPVAIAAGGVAGFQKPDKVDRCRFWPNCRDEARCRFYHPSKPCMNFPNCWYGDQCLFIHPVCKFANLCAKPMCPYVHVGPKISSIPPVHVPTAVIPPPQQQQFAVTKSAETTAPTVLTDAGAKTTTNGVQLTSPAATSSPLTTPVKTTSSAPLSVEASENGCEQAPASGGPTSDGENQKSGSGSESAPETTTANTVAPTAAGSATLSTIPTFGAKKFPSQLCHYRLHCRDVNCTFEHPKKCHYDENCTNPICRFWHPKKNQLAAARFSWKKTEATTA